MYWLYFLSTGVQLREFCQYGTREECTKLGQSTKPCTKLHFRKIIRKHTDGRRQLDFKDIGCYNDGGLSVISSISVYSVS